MNTRKLPVVFAGIKPFMNNMILNRDYMSQFPGGESATFLTEKIKESGYKFMTIDLYLKENPKQTALLISDMGKGASLSGNLIPTLSFSLESPIIANRYYHNIHKKTHNYFKVLDWHGVQERIHNSSNRFIPIAWPNLSTPTSFSNHLDWHKRRYIVIVNSNKRAFKWHKSSLKDPHYFFRQFVANFYNSWTRMTDPWMKVELYSLRLEAICHFAQYSDFDLFGNGWDLISKDSPAKLSSLVSSAYRGLMTSKKTDLSNYKFCICFENTIFPGYLTEKIFDCFFAGVIPIYFGDPLVTSRIPSETFIDFRNFKSFNELDDYCRSINYNEATEYIMAAQNFLSSELFKPFTADYFANNIIDILNEMNENYI